MDAAFVLYDQMTALDLVGPYEVLAGHPQVRPQFVAETLGTVRCDNGLAIQADATFDDLPGAELIVVPGSSQWRTALDDDVLLKWLTAAHPTATWTTSVCTGSTLLAKAGILTGRRATSHWVARDTLAADGAIVSTDRVVIDGDVITCAGVSAGIDMALTLAATLWGSRGPARSSSHSSTTPSPPSTTARRRRRHPRSSRPSALCSATRDARDHAARVGPQAGGHRPRPGRVQAAALPQAGLTGADVRRSSARFN